MNFWQILILGLVQGAAELLPVSSSAHVIVAEKLMGLNPSSPEMTFLLVMLHTGTMFAVIVYFWNSWLDRYFSDAKRLGESAKNIVVATGVTLVLGLALKMVIEKVFMHGQPKAEVEELFSYLPLIGGALLAAGLFILYSGMKEEKWPGTSGIDGFGSALIGAVQGLCLPFRGFSRSGGTISAGLLLGIERRQIEEFSFALAVVLTPFADGWELLRLIKAHPEMTHGGALVKLLTPGLLGMVCSFVAGFVALKLLSQMLETGRWKYFGYYCLVAALVVFGLAYAEKAEAPSAITEVAPNGTDATDRTDRMETTSLPGPAAMETNAAPAPVAPVTNAESAPIMPGTASDQSQAAATNGAPETNAAAATNTEPSAPVPATNTAPGQ
ncbi:MAG: undecaprenyl-diphosphate phosphatase [Methylacidiphilales bacterium]|nr:undecaprenyl-diphosphate phosphatase [Candidatus Methylacidiphilales bacterium]